MDNNQKEIIVMLNGYTEEYKQVGQTLGDKLAEGFEPAIQKIKDEIASITASISAARSSAVSDLSSGSSIAASSVSWHADGGIFDKPSIIGVGDSKFPEAVVPIDKLVGIIREAFGSSTGAGKVINNVNITSPVKQTPAEQNREMENTLRKLAFQIA